MTFVHFCVGAVICAVIFIVTGFMGWMSSINEFKDDGAPISWAISTFGFAICLTILLYQNGIIK